MYDFKRKLSFLFSLCSAMSVLLFNSGFAASAPLAGAYDIDADHSSVLFTIRHLGTSDLNGRFNALSGKIHLEPNGKSGVEVAIQAASVDTNHDKRDEHLRSPDFLNVKQFPVIKFKSDKVVFDNEGLPKEIIGHLSLHGKTQPVTLQVEPIGAGKDPWGGYRLGLNADTRINRSDFGMKLMQDAVGDDIEIRISIEAIRK